MLTSLIFQCTHPRSVARDPDPVFSFALLVRPARLDATAQLFVYWLSITHPRPVARNGGSVFASAFFVGHEGNRTGGRPPH